MSRGSNSADIGAIFENMFKSTFQEVSLTVPSIIRKITDSKAAGNLIQQVPGDFEIRVPAEEEKTCYNFLVECKASRVETDFTATFRSFMKTKVYGDVRKEARAGAVPVVLFYSTLREEIEVWDYLKIIEHHPNKRVKLPGAPEMTVVTRNLKSLCKHWVLEPKKFAKMFRHKLSDALDKE